MPKSMPAVPFDSPRPERTLHFGGPRSPVPTRSQRLICKEFVNRVAARAGVDFVALWVRSGLFYGDLGDGFELVCAHPAGRTVRTIRSDHEVAEWAREASTFAWSASKGPPPGIVTHVSLGNVFLLFAQETRYIVAVTVREEDPQVAGIQSALAKLSSRLATVEPTSVTGEMVTVDLAFLEAMAMGDQAFVQHMLDLCVQQLEEGSEKLSEAVANHSADQVSYYAHKLRSTARTAGAERLDALLGEVEAEAEAGRLGGVHAAVRGCEQAISAVNRILARVA